MVGLADSAHPTEQEVKITSTTDIDAAPEAVWPYVANPVLMSLWNEKIVAVDRPNDVNVQPGETFAMVYRMSGRDNESDVEVTACDEPRALTYRHTITYKGEQRYVDEHYELTPRDGGVRVSQSIDMSQMGVPLWLRALLWFISTFGKPRGPEPLDDLKRVVENPPPPEIGVKDADTPT